MANNWDLTYIFKNDEEFEEQYIKAFDIINRIEKYKGKITNSIDEFKAFLKEKEEIEIFIENIYMYAHLIHDVNTTSDKYQKMFSKAQNLYSKYYEKSSFVINEYIDNADKIKEFLKEKELSKYTHHFDEVFSKREHILTDKEESVLASVGELQENSYNSFIALNDVDMKFDDVFSKKLTGENFTVFLELKNREERQKAYENLYSKYKEYVNTYSNILKSNVKYNNIISKIRKYPSSLNRSLSENFIDEKIYDKLLKIVNDNLFRLHEYMDYRKEMLGLDKLNMYDVYVSTSSNFDISYTIEEAKKIMFEALAPLGQEYLDILKKCFDENWIDFEMSDSKVGGAYSSGGYKTKPYILMSWNNNLSSLYTLAHEIGHSIHSYYSRHSQEYIYNNYTLFLAEIASTTNENLLTHYLLNKYKDNKEAMIYILNDHLDGYRGTVYRQTQFAEFEKLIYQLDQDSEVLTAKRLCDEYRNINEKYYGKNVISDEYISYEWARIPHFYYFFYVYQYAIGFSCAVYFANSIINKGAEAVEKYKGFLKAGCSKNSIQILKDAGLDVINNDVIEQALKEFSNKLEMLRKL